MATPPTQCPCGLSFETIKEFKKVNLDTMCCTAPDADGNACGRRLADHPREAQLTTPQAQDDQQSELLRELNRKMEFIQSSYQEIQSIVPLVLEMSSREHNLWTPSVVSGGRNGTYRKELMKEMGYNNNTKKPICMVSGISGGGDKIICGHIVPCSSPQHKLNELNIDIKDLNKSENCVFWCAGFEEAYETLKISFVRTNPLSEKYFLKFWIEGAKAIPLWPGCTTGCIGDYDGRELNLRGHRIWKRALSYQAYQGYLANNLHDLYLREQTLYGSPGSYRFAKKMELLQKEYRKLVVEETDMEEH